MFREIRKELTLQAGYFLEAFHFWRLTVKYNATHHTQDDIQKMQYTISRETHTIEKGMSMRSPRKGFGQQKVTALIEHLNQYCNLYFHKDSSFLEYPLNTIQTYIDYTVKSGVDITDIQNHFMALTSRIGAVKIQRKAGIEKVAKKQILENCNKDFESLLYSRHSIRYFKDSPVERNLLEKALKMAQRTPSACNRQAWLTHVYREEKSVALIKWQSGSRGFEDEIKTSILVTANLKGFLAHEVHQAYIDGGLYAMNLINALHSLGLGTIPLSCGFSYKHLKGLANFNIPDNEVPILIIGVGNLMDEFNVAISERKNINRTNTFHE